MIEPPITNERVEDVVIDADGRIFRVSNGAQVIAPGLEPERVLRGLADADAGRLTPLGDFAAELEAEAGE